MTLNSAISWIKTYVPDGLGYKNRIIRALQKDAFIKGATQNGTLSVDEAHLVKLWMQFTRKNQIK